MQRGVNRMILEGFVGQKPEIKPFPNGGCVANFTVATSEIWKDKATGEDREETEWHNVAIYGQLAEVCGERLDKGDEIYIEGRLKTHKFQDSQGADRYITKVEVKPYVR